MEQIKRDCAFQYAKMTTHFSTSTDIVCDNKNLTLDEAKELWNKYFPDCAKHIHRGPEYTCEMVLWINMKDSNSYGESLSYISTDAESDGFRIWETVKNFFPQKL